MDENELFKSFLFGCHEKRVQFGIFLNHSDAHEYTITYEHPTTGHVLNMEKSKILLELWSIEFKYDPSMSSQNSNFLYYRPKFRDGNESSMTKLYKLASYFARSMWAIMRLLPAQSLASKGIKLSAEIDINCALQSEALREPFCDGEPDESSNILEKLEFVHIGLLSTLHGDLDISVHFRTDCNLCLTPKTKAIEVPKKLLPEHEIKIENSPDWVDMSSQFASSRPRTEPKSVSYRPVIVPSASEIGTSQELTDFIKFFEKPPEMKWLPRTKEKQTVSSLLNRLDRARADKIVLDRWLEDIELAQEQSREALDFSEFLDSME